MLALRVEAIQDQTLDTKTFFLKDVDGKEISYEAGQFITLIFNHKPTEIRRSFSLSSAPGDEFLAITVKRVPNGEISRYLFAHIHVGHVFTALEPTGKFTLTYANGKHDVIYFAAGSGIVPIYAHLKWIFKNLTHAAVTLIYSNSNPSNTIFYRELQEMAEMHRHRFKLILLFSEAKRGLMPLRLNNELLIRLLNDNISYEPAKAQFFICGPFTYMRMVMLTLTFMDFKPEQIRKENFVIETASAPVDRLNFVPRNIKLQYKGAVYNLAVGQNQSILDAALQNNIALPYSCKAGICSSCTAKCSKGKVVMPVNDVLTDADLAQGWILTCTAHPISDDVLIEFL